MTQKHRKFFTALEEYTEDLKVKSEKNPVLLNLNGEDFSVYLGNLGPLTKEKNVVKHSLSVKNISTQRQRYRDGFKIAFIGVYKGGSNYCAWDLQRIFSSKAKNSTTMRAPKSRGEGKVEFSCPRYTEKLHFNHHASFRTRSVFGQCRGVRFYH